jgi:hypothetical protein
VLAGALDDLGDSLVDVRFGHLDVVALRDRVESEHGANLPLGARAILFAQLLEPLRVSFERRALGSDAIEKILHEGTDLSIH